MINLEDENELRLHLGRDEKLVWTGRPRRGMLLRASDLYLIPFSVLWLGFAVFWEYRVMSGDAPFFFGIWGIPFILIGLYVTIGRFFIDAKKRAGTVYGMTNDRIMIKSGIFRRDIQSLNIRTISDISLQQKSDNSGTITLGPVDPRYAMMQGMDWPGVKQAPRLEMIEDVKAVYDKIISLQREK